MRTYKIGSIETDLAENAEDLSLRRYAQLKEFLIQKETGVPVPSLTEAMKGFVKGFDNKSPSEMLITLHNFLTGVKQVEALEDADQYIFSIICLEKGESPTEYDKSKAKEKIKRFNDAGLKQGELAAQVEAFLKGSPILSGLYLMRSLANLKNE
jgi:hypothetical protein